MNLMNMLGGQGGQGNLLQLYQQAQQMVQGKSPEQINQMVQNLARERGVDLNNVDNNQLMGLAQQLQSLGIKF